MNISQQVILISISLKFRWIAFLQILIYRCMELFIIMPLDIHFVAYTVGIKLLKLYNHQLI